MGKVSFSEFCKSNKPTSLKEWDVFKNGPLVDSISFSSHKKYWFICSECGTSFQTSPHSIVNTKHNCCPKCWIKKRGEARHKTASLKNSILSYDESLALEFDSVLNKTTPDQISINDNKKYWWTCSKCGNKWQASPSNRKRGTGCPKCNRISHTSFPEQAIFYYLSKEYPDAINGDKHLGVELDIYIPSKNVAIEYDGEAWHQDRKKDEKKNKICEKHKIILIRVRENNCWFWKENEYLKCLSVSSGNKKDLSECIKNVIFMIDDKLFYKPDVDVERDELIIKSTYTSAKTKNSLIEKYPEMAKEWDYEKNSPITPDNVDFGSGTKYWWKCLKCGYSFQATPNSRTYKGTGCPSCAHIVANSGVNDLETLFPTLVSEWDFSKNSKLGLVPNKILPNSDKKAWWKCKSC